MLLEVSEKALPLDKILEVPPGSGLDYCMGRKGMCWVFVEQVIKRVAFGWRLRLKFLSQQTFRLAGTSSGNRGGIAVTVPDLPSSL